MKTLFNYQKQVFRWAKERDKVALLLEMRLGKTIVTIRWAKARGYKKCLVVCPLSVIPTWENELAEENLPRVVFTNDVKSAVPLFQKMPELWCITNYEQLRQELFNDWEWDAVILDESTRIRKIQTKLTKRCLHDFDHVKGKAILTGCPNPETLIDLYTQFKFLDINLCGCESYWDFKHRYFYTDWDGKLKATRHQQSYIERETAKNAAVLHREDVDIGSTKLYEERFCHFDKLNREIYDDVEQTWEMMENETKWVIVANNWLHQIAGGFPKKERKIQSLHKIKELITILKENFKGEQVVVWARYVREIKAIVKACRHYGISANGIIGAIPIEKRKQCVERFQARKFEVLACQLRTARFGLDLSAADTAIYYSNSWEAEDRIQSEDRIIHPKKKTPLLIIDLITSNTIDQDIVGALKDKKSVREFFISRVKKLMELQV